MATTITHTALTDDDGSGTTGTILNAAWQTAFDNAINAMFTADPTIFTSLCATTLVGTWGNRIKYDGANLLFIGIPGTASAAKKVVFVDSAGSGVATIDSQGMGSFNSAVRSASPTVPSGYSTGAGGAVTQITSKATGVTLNTVTGQITMNNAALNAGVKVSFVVTDSAVAAVDIPSVAVVSGGTANAYRASVTAVAAGSFTVTVENITGGSLSEAPVIGFVVTKGSIT